VAVAAGVTLEQVRASVVSERIRLVNGFLGEGDAVRLVRLLGDRLPINLVERKRRRGGLPLAVSGSLHAAAVALFLLASSLGLLKANDTETQLDDKEPPRLVFLMQPSSSSGESQSTVAEKGEFPGAATATVSAAAATGDSGNAAAKTSAGSTHSSSARTGAAEASSRRAGSSRHDGSRSRRSGRPAQCAAGATITEPGSWHGRRSGVGSGYGSG
jgi:hypothetical protein